MKLQFDPNDLRPIIAECVAATIREIETIRVQFSEKLLHTEPEAAAILGLKPGHLGDLRRRGEVPHQKLGERVFYSRTDILKIAGMEGRP